MIPTKAVVAAAAAYQNTTPLGDGTHQYRAIRAALEAAAPYMPVVPDSDAVLAILEAAGVDKVNQFDALVAVQKLAHGTTL